MNVRREIIFVILKPLVTTLLDPTLVLVLRDLQEMEKIAKVLTLRPNVSRVSFIWCKTEEKKNAKALHDRRLQTNLHQPIPKPKE